MRPRRYGDNSRPYTNKILASLPGSCQEWVEALEPVALAPGAILHEPDEAIEHVYFLSSALVSIISMNSEGATVEIGLIAQSSICNCYHTLQERLCRWLLVARDAVQGDVLLLTHDVIARLLGTRRASVTVAAGLLQRAGLIQIRRGQITIIDPAGLESMSCECYAVLRDGIRRVESS